MKRFLSVSTGLLILLGAVMGVPSAYAQESERPFDTIPLKSLGEGVVLSPDNSLLAVYEQYIYEDDDAPQPDKLPIQLINMTTHEVVGTLTSATDWVTGAVFTPDNQYLISIHRNGDVIVWDVASMMPIKTISAFLVGGSSIQMLADGKTVMVRFNDFVSALLDTETGAITRLMGRHINNYSDFTETYTQFPGRGDIALSTASVSKDGHWLATATQNDQVTLFNLETQEEWVLRDPSERAGLFSIRSLVFSADGSQLVYYDRFAKETHWWDVAAHTEIRSVDFGGVTFAVAPDLTTLVWIDPDKMAVYSANTATDEEPALIITLPETLKAPPLATLTFTSDGQLLILGGLYASDEKNAIYVIDLS